MQTLTLVPAGLHTDPNPLSLAPDGALSEALNVWIRRPGVLEPRPPLGPVVLSITGPDEHVAHLFQYGETFVIVTVDNSDVGRVYRRKGATSAQITQTGTLAGDAFWSVTQPTRIRGVTCQGNHYLTVGEGVMRIAGETATTAPRAGLVRPPTADVFYNTVNFLNYPLKADTAVAYRLVYKQRIGEREYRSPPSARIVQRSYTGSAAKNVSLILPFNAPYDVEVYRSTAFIAGYKNEPTDEMTLIGTIPAGTTTWTDDVPVSHQRGASLYTNQTQQGAVLENGITPLCRDLAVYREMLCFAGATRPPRLSFEILGYGPDWRNGSDFSAQRCGTGGGMTATVTSGSNSVTGLSAANIKQVQVGMLVVSMSYNPANPAGGDAWWPANTTVASVNVAGGSFTTSANALANDTNVIVLDWIEIAVTDGAGTTTARFYPNSNLSGGLLTDANEFSSSTSANVAGIQKLMTRFNDAFETKNVIVSGFGDGVTTPWTIVAEAFKYDATSITVRCNRPDYTSDRISSTTGKSATVSGGPSYLEFSKPREPEHVPPGYFLQLGDLDGAIDRIVPTRDSLFVFKTDGIFRVSGYTPDTLQVDEFDRTMQLVHPEAACEWEGGVAAWTDRGLFLMSDGGAVEIGAPIASDLREYALAIGEDLEIAGNGRGVFLAPWRHEGVLMLGVTTAATTVGSADYIYIWNSRARAWTRWSHAKKITSFLAINEDEVFGIRTDSGVDAQYLELKSSYDASFSVVVSVVSGTSITISAGSGWTPAVGDVVSKGGVNYFVVSVASATQFEVHKTGLTTGAASALQSAPSIVSWVARDAENPGAQKHWRDITLLFGLAPNALDLRVDCTTDRSATVSSVHHAFDGDEAPKTVRTRVQRESRKCARLFPTMQLSTANERAWELHGISMVYEPMETRHRNVP